MLVKKMPILQGFPAFETVRELSGPRGFSEDFSPVFYDIETTGLSRNSTFLYLIGAAAFEDGQWQMHQWLGIGAEEEKSLLEEFSDFMKNFTCTIQYNGNSFDQPYLEARYQLHKLANPFEGIPSIDLYRELKPLKKLLKLPGMKQPQLEEFLGAVCREHCDGKECIRLYKKLEKRCQDTLIETVLGHNEEDLLGLGRTFSMLGYLGLFEGCYEVAAAEADGENLLVCLKPDTELPAQFSNGNENFYITGSSREIRLAVKTQGGRLKQYYEDYKNYDYLPGEDTAVPKALSAYMDKSLRVSARPETCYTWFACTRDFAEDFSAVKKYLKHSLPMLLKGLP